MWSLPSWNVAPNLSIGHLPSFLGALGFMYRFAITTPVLHTYLKSDKSYKKSLFRQAIENR